MESMKVPDRLKRFVDEWQDTFLHSEDVVFLMDSRFNVVWGNKKFLEKTGFGASSSPKKCHEFMGHARCPFCENSVDVFMRDGKPYTMEITGEEGEPLLVTILPVFDKQNKIVVGAVHVVKDLSPHKNMQEFINLLQMAGNAAHGINNGLAVINCNLDVAIKYVEIILCREDLMKKMREAVGQKAWDDVSMYADQINQLEEKVSFLAIKDDLLPLIHQTREGSVRVRQATRTIRFFMPRGERS